MNNSQTLAHDQWQLKKIHNWTSNINYIILRNVHFQKKLIVFEEQNLVKEKKKNLFRIFFECFIFDIEWGVFSLKFLM